MNSLQWIFKNDGQKTPDVILGISDGFFPHETVEAELYCDGHPYPVID